MCTPIVVRSRAVYPHCEGLRLFQHHDLFVCAGASPGPAHLPEARYQLAR